MTKTKFYKDPNRGKQEPFKPYVPAYQIHGIAPEQIAAGRIPVQMQLTKHAPVISYDNPRIRPTPTVRQNVPYADVPSEPSPIGKGPIPNIGNNIETSWFSVDGEDLDQVFIDESDSSINANLDPNQAMIDNNDDDEQNYQNIPKQIKVAPSQIIPEDLEDEEIQYPAQYSLNIGDDEYVLVVANSILGVGPLEEIQEVVRALIFGEHELSQKNMTPDDIIVLKRVKIKVGVFLE